MNSLPPLHWRVALMAKAPEPGRAKTRLAPALGEDGAARLAARLLRHAGAQALAACATDPARIGDAADPVAAGIGDAADPVAAGIELWAAPDAQHAAFAALRAAASEQGCALATAAQPEADLGTRMRRVFEQPAAGDAAARLLIGSDAPALDAQRLRHAARALRDERLDVVFVPALDGGYALVGLRAAPPRALLDALFAPQLPWSRPQLLAVTRERLAAGGWRHAELPAVADIDTPDDLVHLPPGWLDTLADRRTAPGPAAPAQQAAADPRPGRSCPLHYRYAPAALAAAEATRCATLYVVGGLYGNDDALRQVLALYAAEPGVAGRDKRLVFNGDFHWFDAEPALFAQVDDMVAAHDALRGNVETEIASDDVDGQGDAGCGCAYPAWVGDGVVERSNRILQRLRGVARATPDAARRLARLRALPMWRVYAVGSWRVGVVHGDAGSLAGWGFAQEQLRDPAARAQAVAWLAQARVDAFASSHTCLPVFQALARPGTPSPGWVLNNGATGMPNFGGRPDGLLTRIASAPFDGPAAARRHGLVQDGVHVDALAVDAAGTAWRARFGRLWPAGSDAALSYGARIAAGPDYAPGDALRVSG